MTSATRAASERQFYTAAQEPGGGAAPAERRRPGGRGGDDRAPPCASWTSSCPASAASTSRPCARTSSALVGELREVRAGRRAEHGALAAAPAARPARVTRRLARSSSSTSTAPSSTPAATSPPPSTRRCARVAPGRAAPAAERRPLVHRQRGARRWSRAALRARPACRSRPRRSLPVFLEDYRRGCSTTHAALSRAWRRRSTPSRDRALAVLTNKPGDMSRAHPRRARRRPTASSASTAAATCPRASPIPAGLRRLMEEAGRRPADDGHGRRLRDRRAHGPRRGRAARSA